MQDPDNLKDLRAFCAVVELGTLSAAAKRMSETKSSISRRLTRLELNLGGALLKRTPRSVEASDAGRLYYQEAQHAIRILQGAARFLHPDGPPSGVLRVNVSPGFAAYVLGPLVPAFHELYPNIALDFIVTDDLVTFASHEIDIAIWPSMQLSDSSLISRKLSDWSGCLVATPDFLARWGCPETIDQIGDYPLIARLNPKTETVRELIVTTEIGKPPRRIPIPMATITTNTVVARESVMLGDCIALLPDVLVRRHLDSGKLVKILPTCRFEGNRGSMFLLHAPTAFVVPKIQAFRTFLLERLGLEPATVKRPVDPASRQN